MSTPIQINLETVTQALIDSLDESQKVMYDNLIASAETLKKDKGLFNSSLTYEQRQLKKHVEVAKKAYENETRLNNVKVKSKK